MTKIIRGQRERIENVETELATKLTHQHKDKIMEYFKRFAEYRDFKDLYKKTVPIV